MLYKWVLKLLLDFHGENPVAFPLIFMAEIQQCFASDAMTKLLMWEYGNGDAPFSRQKSSRVSRLVHYGTLEGFMSVYTARIDVLTPWRVETLQSVKTHWYVLHTWGNQCHLMTWVKTITPRWTCIQYSMNMHLRQLPWAHTHTTRSRALMTRKGHSRSNKSPSYKVQNHPHTQAYIYTHAYASYTMLSHRVGK